jgi:Raf kinase inhibitor-like YbhB/YbcL family protein
MRSIPAICVIASAIGFNLVPFGSDISAGFSDPAMVLTSSAFQNNGNIPQRYTCSGNGISPALQWTGVPDGTRSLALICDDPDAPIGTFVHWVVYNLPPNSKGIAEGVSASASRGNGEQGLNGRGEIGYTGPCPPPVNRITTIFNCMLWTGSLILSLAPQRSRLRRL